MTDPPNRLLPQRGVREPFNAASHLLGALLALAGGIYLVVASAGEPWRTASFAIYALASVALFTASTLLHALPLDTLPLDTLPLDTLAPPASAGSWRQRADHAAIFLLIAGSYTPITLVTLRGRGDGLGWLLFGGVWVLAFAGVVFKILWFRAPRWLSTTLYVVLGWTAVLAIGPIVAAMRPGGVALLIAGGLLYTVGAVIYARKWPDPAPTRVGYHGLWHLLVLAGWGAHYAMLALYVLPS